MGHGMASGDNNLQSKADASGKGLVDHQETSNQGLPTPAKRSVRGLDWTAILDRAGLESPGYKETVDQMKKEGKLR